MVQRLWSHHTTPYDFCQEISWQRQWANLCEVQTEYRVAQTKPWLISEHNKGVFTTLNSAEDDWKVWIARLQWSWSAANLSDLPQPPEDGRPQSLQDRSASRRSRRVEKVLVIQEQFKLPTFGPLQPRWIHSWGTQFRWMPLSVSECSKNAFSRIFFASS